MTPKQVLKNIEKNLGKNFMPIVGPEKGKLLESIVEQYKPKNILEVGTFVGYSAILMASHLGRGAKLTTIEMDAEPAQEAMKNFEKAGLHKKITIINGDAMKEIPKLSGPFDMLFLDAQKDEYYSCLLLAETKLSPFAIIVADNVKIFEDEMRDYLEYVRESPKFSSQTYEFGEDAMEITIKKKEESLY